MLLYCHTISPRLQYTADIIAHLLTDSSALLTTDKAEFANYKGPKINYSDEYFDFPCLRIVPYGLLYETDIRPQEIKSFIFQGMPAFFSSDGDIPFDLLSAQFYLVSRYEEYLPFQADEYGRFPYHASLACREKFLHRPLVEEWVMMLKEKITQTQSDAEKQWKKIQGNIELTYDIDMAWSYRYKSLLRNAGGMLRSMLMGQFSAVRERITVLSGKKQDPFDCFEWLNDLHKKIGVRPLYFFLVAEQKGKYDKNLSPHHPAMIRLFTKTAECYETGLHPSWQSNGRHKKIRREKKILEVYTGKEIFRSRQHYIRLQLPKTYRQLIKAGIREDYSMGYGSINGFRASISTPFYWFDLEKNEISTFRIHPFCFMDANAFYEEGKTPDAALEQLREYQQILSRTGGVLNMIWHNNFLGNDPQFRGWREMYQAFLVENLHPVFSRPDHRRV